MTASSKRTSSEPPARDVRSAPQGAPIPTAGTGMGRASTGNFRGASNQTGGGMTGTQGRGMANNVMRGGMPTMMGNMGMGMGMGGMNMMGMGNMGNMGMGMGGFGGRGGMIPQGPRGGGMMVGGRGGGMGGMGMGF
jgi:hypothetical protein